VDIFGFVFLRGSALIESTQTNHEITLTMHHEKTGTTAKPTPELLRGVG
jgi:hypothetical protein